MTFVVSEFVNGVLGDYVIDWKQTTPKRIFFVDTPLFIRMWNITETGIDYTIYRPVGDAAEAVRNGYFAL